MQLIGTGKWHGRHYIIERDDAGFYCKVNGIVTQRHLTATEVIRWLLHVINDEM